MCKSKSKRIEQNAERLRATAVEYDILSEIAKDRNDLVARLCALKEKTAAANPAADKDVLKLDEKIDKKREKLRKTLLKESAKGVYKKSYPLLRELEIMTVERGCADRLSAPADEADFEIEDGVLKRYKGNGGRVVLPTSVKIVGERAFYNCTTIGELICGDRVTNIGEHAFEYCTGLSEVTLGKSVASIGDSAFYNCGALNSVILEEGLVTIGPYAFAKCPSLYAVKIPKSLIKVCDKAFFLDGNLNKKAKRRIKKLNAKALK